jgi:DNA-binding CsgD family transcriptional regulator
MQYPLFTPLEQQIIQSVSGGRTNEETARILTLTLPSLENKLATIYTKLGVTSRVDCCLVFVRGW